MFSFNNWKKFRDKIKLSNNKIVKFDLQYHQCNFRIIYSLAQNVFIIALQGTQKGFILNLEYYQTHHNIKNELYKTLANCKDTVYDPNKRYNPFDFLIELDKFIGSENINFSKPNSTDYQTINTCAIPDEEKIFFQRWIPHNTGHVTNKNLSKIEKLLGYNIKKFCEENNISIGFRSTPTERSLEMIQDFKSDYKQFNNN